MLKKGQPTPDEPSPPVVEPHPAEDLSADDDLLSWILVDQLGALPNTRLGVHPQQVKFVGPMFKTEEVMDIVKEVRRVCLHFAHTMLTTQTVVKGHINEAMQRLQE
jgi:histone-lysine N-methyltransferase SUV420H